MFYGTLLVRTWISRATSQNVLMHSRLISFPIPRAENIYIFARSTGRASLQLRFIRFGKKFFSDVAASSEGLFHLHIITDGRRDFLQNNKRDIGWCLENVELVIQLEPTNIMAYHTRCEGVSQFTFGSMDVVSCEESISIAIIMVDTRWRQA